MLRPVGRPWNAAQSTPLGTTLTARAPRSSKYERSSLRDCEELIGEVRGPSLHLGEQLGFTAKVPPPPPNSLLGPDPLHES